MLMSRGTRAALAVAITALSALTACSGGGAKEATTTAPTTTSTTTPSVVYPPTKLQVSGYSPGVNQAPFYPTVEITKVTCAAAGANRTVTVALPPGGSFPAATTIVASNGRAELRDTSGKKLYEEVKPKLAPADHGSFVLSMTAVASTDSAGHRVPAGAVNVVGDYLCP